jgi:hypothetical protein
MKILLDECVPQQVRHALPGHVVVTAQKMGWAGLANGDLLATAEQAGFEVFVVADKNLRYQQDLSSRRIAILELWTNHRPTLERHFPKILAAVERIKAGDYMAMEGPGRAE